MNKIYQKNIPDVKSPVKRNFDGFTLIELLVVVLIIGILAAIALPQYEVAVRKARLAKYMSLVASMKEAQEIYFLANGQYSDDLSMLDLSFPISDDCTHKRTSGSYDAYYCDEGVTFGIFDSVSNVQAGDDYNRYLQVLHNNDAWNFKKGEIYCFADGDAAIKVCKSMGGIEHTPCSTVWDKCFRLP